MPEETYNRLMNRLREVARNKVTPVSIAKKAIPAVGKSLLGGPIGQAMVAKDIYDMVTSIIDVLGSEGVLNRTPDIESIVSKIQQPSTKGRLEAVSKQLLPTHDDKAVVDRIDSGWRDVDPSMLKQQQQRDREAIDSSIMDISGYHDDMWDSYYDEASDLEDAKDRIDQARVETMRSIWWDQKMEEAMVGEGKEQRKVMSFLEEKPNI